ncbi:unnamed protein product, partial [marine sediment metagenome]
GNGEWLGMMEGDQGCGIGFASLAPAKQDNHFLQFCQLGMDVRFNLSWDRIPKNNPYQKHGFSSPYQKHGFSSPHLKYGL